MQPRASQEPTRYATNHAPPVRVIAVALLPLLALFAVACGGGSKEDAAKPDAGLEKSAGGGSTANITIAPNADPKPGGTLVYGLEAETDSMLPTQARFAVSGLMYANAVFDPVAAYDKDGEPQPYLAEKWSHSDDYRTWSITFRSGISFHNGEKLDAEAGIMFINAIKDSSLTGPAARPIESVVKTGELSADVKMNVPWVSFPHLMTGQGGMLPAPAQLKAFTSTDENTRKDAARKPIGTGPFVFKEWIPDREFVAVKNKSYWRKDLKGNALPYLDEVQFKPLTDPDSRVRSLQSGTVNMIHDSRGRTVKKLKDLAAAGELQFVLGGGEDEESFIMLNTQKPPLDDLRVRQALAYATDLAEYFAVTEEDPTLQADSPFNQDSPWYTETGYPTYDPAKAKELVAAWQKDHPGEQLEFDLGATVGSTDNDAIIQMLKSQWDKVGITATVQQSEQVVFILGSVTGKFEASLWRQFSAIDPDSDFHFWTGKNALSPDKDGMLRLNFANNVDPELDKALDEGRSNPDPAVRKSSYSTVGKRFAESVPYLWLQHVRWSIAADKTVRGMLNGPLPDGKESLPVQAGVHRLTSTWLER